MAADEPDRNLRFILGHAFTLDKLRLRIAEIEVSGSSDSDSDEDLPETTHNQVCTKGMPHVHAGAGAGTGGERRVSFQGNSKAQGTTRNRSPPPPQLEEDTDSDDDDDAEEDDEDDGLGLVRFGSATAQPPRILEDEEVLGDNLGEEDIIEGEEIEVGEKKYTEAELKRLCEGEGNKDLVEAYGRVAGCPCHGEKGPHVEKFWELPQPEGAIGPRMAVMQVA